MFWCKSVFDHSVYDSDCSFHQSCEGLRGLQNRSAHPRRGIHHPISPDPWSRDCRGDCGTWQGRQRIRGGPKGCGRQFGISPTPSNSCSQLTVQELCGECFYCRRGEVLLCENFESHGVTINGGFAEYCAYPAGKVFRFHNLSYIDATLLEPASCAAHGLDRIAPKMGSSVLMFGSGPTGMMLAQLLRQCGGCHVVIAAHKNPKMDVAKAV